MSVLVMSLAAAVALPSAVAGPVTVTALTAVAVMASHAGPRLTAVL
jgi:hypothetical protein